MRSVILSFGLAAFALAQGTTPTGSISGTLYDSIGDPIDNNLVQAEEHRVRRCFQSHYILHR